MRFPKKILKPFPIRSLYIIRSLLRLKNNQISTKPKIPTNTTPKQTNEWLIMNFFSNLERTKRHGLPNFPSCQPDLCEANDKHDARHHNCNRWCRISESHLPQTKNIIDKPNYPFQREFLDVKAGLF